MAAPAEAGFTGAVSGVVINDDFLLSEMVWGLRMGLAQLAEQEAPRSHGEANGDPLEPLRKLRPPTFQELARAHRAGGDPNVVLRRFDDRYGAAIDEASRRIDAAAGDDPRERRRLWDAVNDFAMERREEWFVAPRLAIARVLNPGVTAAETRQLAGMLRRSLCANPTVSFERRPSPGDGQCRPA